MTTELRFVERLVQRDICGVGCISTERVLQYRSTYFLIANPRAQLWDDWRDAPVVPEHKLQSNPAAAK